MGAQVINVISLPVIARLYAPGEYAVWAIVLATAAIFSMIACLRYELAIVLPTKDSDASMLFWCCLVLCLCMGGGIGSVLLLPWVRTVFATSSLHVIPEHVLIIFGLITATGAILALRYWCIRQKSFALNSVGQIVLAASTICFQISYATYFVGNSLGLMLGSLFGQVMSAGVMFAGLIFIRKIPRFELKKIVRLPGILKKHRKFPQYSTPYTLFGCFRDRASIFVLQYFLSSNVVGIYAFTYRVMNFPINLISSALRPVLFQQVAATGVQSVEKRINGILTFLVIAVTPFLVFYFFYSKEIFVLLLGEKWGEAGHIGKFIILPVYTFLFCNWMDRIMDVLGKQRYVLCLELIFSFLSIGGLLLGFILNFGFDGALLIQSFVLVSYNLYYLCATFKVAGYSLSNLGKLLTLSVIQGLLTTIAILLFKSIFNMAIIFFLLVLLSATAAMLILKKKISF